MRKPKNISLQEFPIYQLYKDIPMKNYLFISVCAVFLLASCGSQGSAKGGAVNTASSPSLEAALSNITAYYKENLPANNRVALVNFEADAPLLSAYIFEELWILFEDSRSFILVDRQNLERIQKEMDYQLSGEVSDKTAQALGEQFGAQTLVYGSIKKLGGEYRLVVNATDVEKAVTSMRSATVSPDQRFAALLEQPSGSKAGAGMANALYTDTGNPWRFTVQTDRISGDYRDGDYMTMRIYSEKAAWFKVTHIDVNGNTQVIYPVSRRDNNFIRAGETRQIPDNTQFRMTQPYGEEMILVAAYDKPFVVHPDQLAPLSNQILMRGLIVESEDTQADMRPVATAKFSYRISR